MKVGTLNHPKLRRLCRLLGVPKYAAAGILESLWQLAAEAADEGDVGRFTDPEIADYIEWEGDPDKLVEALVEGRWLDPSESRRLVVHDWRDHCPKYITERLKKRAGRKAKRLGRNGDSAGTVERRNGDQAGTTRRQQGDTGADVPSIPNPTKQIPSTSGDRWMAVEGDLKAVGMAAAKAAAKAARDRGLTVAQVRELVAEFKAGAGAWGPGALQQRLTGTLAAWPPPDAAHQRERSRSARDAAAAKTAEKNAEDRRRAADEAAKRGKLENEHGPALDAMSKAQVSSLLREVFPNPAVLKFAGKSMRRLALLEKIAERNGQDSV